MRRPALLRFTSDDFMDVFTAALRDHPESLTELRAVPTSHREVPAGAPPDWKPTADRLKLFQPIHGEFTLVAASLVCGLSGLPDHSVATTGGQRVAFVLRRLAATATPLTPGTAGAELAWAPDPEGGRRWAPVPAGAEDQTVPGEELFALFPVAYLEAGTDRARRIYAGLVPTSSRETFRTAVAKGGSAKDGSAKDAPGPVDLAPTPPVPGGKQDDDPRWNAFDVRVIGPLAALQSADPASTVPPDVRREASAFLLLDLADLLRAHLPAVWAAIEGGPAPVRPAEAALLAALRGDSGLDWVTKLRTAASQWAVITGEAAGTSTLSCDLHTAKIAAGKDSAPTASVTLQSLIRAALPGTVPTGEIPAGVDTPKLEPTGEAQYVIRCVYRRPACAQPDLVGERSDAFSIAPVLDADAPARPVRITLPMGTGIKDLRKFRKSVGFLVSNQLRGQMNRITDLKKALDGDLGSEEEWDLGMICQFSLPIITIVALMLLIVIVFLLNIVFFWVPFFRICLPIPLRSKR
jgi:hypothetical protein